MGQVYLAEHIHMRRRCAVKFLHPDLAGTESALQRFLREAENASRIVHPNVVTLYDFGESDAGGVYLAMEYIEGESLRAMIEREKVLPLDVVVAVVRQTASALQAAHGLQIVHRDLKPDNIMVHRHDGDIRVKVVDFGLAKALGKGQTVTMTGVIVGTPDYMSPEQVLADRVDSRSDQYALALVAVKMLTGRLPFAAATSIASLSSRLITEPAPLRELRSDITWPGNLQDVITKALSAEPAQRYPSVADFARAFRDALPVAGAAIS